MKVQDLSWFHARSLRLGSPREFTNAVLVGKQRVVTVFVECASGVAWANPEPDERVEIDNWQKGPWRHQDTCRFQTILTARVPRLLWKNGKSTTASVPWKKPSARVTRTVESYAIHALLNCRTERAASRINSLGDHFLDGIMFRTQARWTGEARSSKHPLASAGGSADGQSINPPCGHSGGTGTTGEWREQ